MPNHCEQQVHIHGQRFLVRAIYDALTKAHPEFCQLIVPMPFETWAAPKTREHGGYEVDGWYGWRLKNWGTKWDVCDVQISVPITYHDTDKEPNWTSPDDTGLASFTFHCWTAWSPPIPVWDKLVKLGLSVDASYQDEGMCFEGEYLNGEDKCWEPEFAQNIAHDQRLEEEDA